MAEVSIRPSAHRVAIGPVELRHVVEVHAVDAGHQHGRGQDDADDRQDVDHLVLLDVDQADRGVQHELHVGRQIAVVLGRPNAGRRRSPSAGGAARRRRARRRRRPAGSGSAGIRATCRRSRAGCRYPRSPPPAGRCACAAAGAGRPGAPRHPDGGRCRGSASSSASPTFSSRSAIRSTMVSRSAANRSPAPPSPASPPLKRAMKSSERVDARVANGDQPIVGADEGDRYHRRRARRAGGHEGTHVERRAARTDSRSEVWMPLTSARVGMSIPSACSSARSSSSVGATRSSQTASAGNFRAGSSDRPQCPALDRKTAQHPMHLPPRPRGTGRPGSFMPGIEFVRVEMRTAASEFVRSNSTMTAGGGRMDARCDSGQGEEHRCPARRPISGGGVSVCIWQDQAFAGRAKHGQRTCR